MYSEKIRIIPKLEIKNENLVKGINFEGLRVLGNPIYFINEYVENLADEIFIQDLTASLYDIRLTDDFIQKISKNFYRKNRKLYIVIMDIPKFSRLVEFMLLPFFNVNRFFFAIKYFTKKDYKKLAYYRHKEKDLFFLNYRNMEIQNLYSQKHCHIL